MGWGRGEKRKEADGLFEEYGQRLGFGGDGIVVGVGISAGEQMERFSRQAVDLVVECWAEESDRD